MNASDTRLFIGMPCFKSEELRPMRESSVKPKAAQWFEKTRILYVPNGLALILPKIHPSSLEKVRRRVQGIQTQRWFNAGWAAK
jgi:hypothetical protein